MDKKIIYLLIAIAVIVVAAAGFSATSNNDTYSLENPELTGAFDFSATPTTDWNSENKELNFKQTISTEDGKDYKDIDMKVVFYKGGKLLDEKTINIDKTNDGAFDLDFKVKLQEEPDEFYYDVISAEEV
ncbi:hypothetical protein [uncultured Methanobrevibacter sp.]|uniref:hypothetical protein n=1 Tax=uncultured Methanobrevibacter sp. TaxID=253161 RepID=UPI0026092A10